MKSKFFIILGLLITSIQVNAQLLDHNLKTFQESISIYFVYPYELHINCMPTIALMKFVIDQNGKVTNMDVSDSADMLFKSSFQASSKKFDIKSLELFAKKFSLKNTAILIPYFIHLSSKNCPSPLTHGDLNKYLVFSSIPLQGNRLYTDPLIAIESDEYDTHY